MLSLIEKEGENDEEKIKLKFIVVYGCVHLKKKKLVIGMQRRRKKPNENYKKKSYFLKVQKKNERN